MILQEIFSNWNRTGFQQSLTLKQKFHLFLQPDIGRCDLDAWGPVHRSFGERGNQPGDVQGQGEQVSLEDLCGRIMWEFLKVKGGEVGVKVEGEASWNLEDCTITDGRVGSEFRLISNYFGFYRLGLKWLGGQEAG